VLIEGVTDVKPARPVPEKVVRRGVCVRNKPAGGGTLRLMHFFWCEDSPTVPGAPLCLWAGVLGAKPTKGATVGFIAGGEDVAGSLNGKGVAFDPPVDALKGKDCLRA
jgi:hypothetical protein